MPRRSRLPSLAICASPLLFASLLVAGCGTGETHAPLLASAEDADAAIEGSDAGASDAAAPLADGPDDGSTTSDSGPVFSVDALPTDAGACTHLNIGIFGNPGSNPSSNFQTWLEMSGTSVARVQRTTSEPLTAAVLKPYDVVVLDWLTRDYTTAEAATLSAWIAAGGGVVSMSGYDNNTTDDWHANSLLAPLGAAYSGPLLNGPVTSFATHPITAGLTSVTFNGGYGISDLGGSASTRTAVAFLADGSGGTVTAGYAIVSGAGHAFVWGDEWIEFDSEWSTLPEIKQFWVQIFGWVAPTNKCALTPPR